MDRDQFHARKKPDDLESYRRKLQVAKSAIRIGEGIAHGQHDRAILSAVSLSTKLANSSPFYNPDIPIVVLFRELLKMGPGVLAKSPETLFALIDKTAGNKTNTDAAASVEHYHLTSNLKTDVPPLVRNKIYAIRTVAITDAPYSEWNIFEKVGGAFSGRLANFSHVEPLSASECAVTLALMNTIRKDTTTKEVDIYVAACCVSGGLYTVLPSKWLSPVQAVLEQLVYENSGEPYSAVLAGRIAKAYDRIAKDPQAPVNDSVEDIQAMKLYATELAVKEALHE